MTASPYPFNVPGRPKPVRHPLVAKPGAKSREAYRRAVAAGKASAPPARRAITAAEGFYRPIVSQHSEARKAGQEDRAQGHRFRADRWPAGEYGHADYELGWTDIDFPERGAR